MLWNYLRCSGRLRDAKDAYDILETEGCLEMLQNAFGCLERLGDASDRWDAKGCSGMFGDALGFFGLLGMLEISEMR